MSQFLVSECHFGISPVNYSDSDLTDKNQFEITKVQTVDPQSDNRGRHVLSCQSIKSAGTVP